MALWDKDRAEAQAVAGALGDCAIGCAVDVTDADAVGAAIAATLGPVAVLVNSAGITGPNAPVAEYDVGAWRRVLEVNLTGTFLCCRAVVPVMRRQDWERFDSEERFAALVAWLCSGSCAVPTGATFGVSGEQSAS